jgi:hypothetical protein
MLKFLQLSAIIYLVSQTVISLYWFVVDFGVM